MRSFLARFGRQVPKAAHGKDNNRGGLEAGSEQLLRLRRWRRRERQGRGTVEAGPVGAGAGSLVALPIGGRIVRAAGPIAAARVEHARMIVARCLLRQDWTATRAAWRRALRAVAPHLDAEDVLHRTGLASAQRGMLLAEGDRLDQSLFDLAAAARAALQVVVRGDAPQPEEPFWIDPYAPVSIAELRSRVADAIALELYVPDQPGPCPYDRLVDEWNRAVRGTSLLTCRALNEQRRARMRRAWTEQLRGSIGAWRRVCQRVASCPWARQNGVAIDHVLWQRTLARRLEEALTPTSEDGLPEAVVKAMAVWAAELQWRYTAEIVALSMHGALFREQWEIDAELIRATNAAVTNSPEAAKRTRHAVKELVKEVVQQAA